MWGNKHSDMRFKEVESTMKSFKKDDKVMLNSFEAATRILTV